MVERSLGISIASKKALLDKIVSTAVREVDSLYEVVTTEGRKFILHLEIQSVDDAQMVYRVGEYHGLVLKKHGLPIEHIVVYLGEHQTKMRNSLKEDEIFSGFELLSIRDMNAKQLLRSNIPEEVLLTILSNYDKNKSKELIQSIILRLNQLSENKNKLKKYASQLIILSNLRNLEIQTTNTVNNMTQLFDITTFSLFQKGRVEGRVEGHEEGFDDGLDKGEQKKQLIIIANMLTKSNLNTKQIADLSEAKEMFVTHVKEQLENDNWSHPETWLEEAWTAYFNEDAENKSH